MLFLLLAAGVLIAADKYEKYSTPGEERVLLKIEIGKKDWAFTFYLDDSAEVVKTYNASEVTKREGIIRVGDEIELSDEVIKGFNIEIEADKVGEIKIDVARAPYVTTIAFIALDETNAKYSFRRQRDKISFWNSITVEKDEFIRGSVVTFFGNADVYGEVNGDVLTVFGDVLIGKEAVVRGDVISVNGTVEMRSGASVYGTVVTSKGEKSTRRHRARRWRKLESDLELSGDIVYNRVDGLKLMAGVSYDDPDSLLPSFEAIGGYAFASNRWRYRLSLIQTIIKGSIPVQLGGRIFRDLKSNDDNLLSNAENSIFAVVFNEDWKDYYEAEGGYGFAKIGFLKWNRFEIGYLAETQNWYDAHPRLWSIFGSKEFRGNFSSVSYDTLRVRRDDFRDMLLTSLNIRLSIDNRDDDRHPRQGWYGLANYEYSPAKWKGKFDFERIEFILKRYQPIRRYITLNLVAAYGRVKGDYIPLNRQFYLGGLGTIHGYRHKEYRGNEYLLASIEYGFRIPRSDISPFIQYNGGKIGSDKLTGNDSWKSSVGIGVYLDENVKVFVARRLDKDDEDLIFYARFSTPI
jgi:hypothetical protein